MPKEDLHLRQATRNERFAEYLLANTCYTGWAVVGIFYAALHYVDAFLAGKIGIPEIGEHKDRIPLVKKHLRVIREEYETLYNFSRQVRYYGTLPSSAKMVREYQEDKLAPIREHVLSQLRFKGF